MLSMVKHGKVLMPNEILNFILDYINKMIYKVQFF